MIGEKAGPVPQQSQGTDFVKNWRRKTPKNSMTLLISLRDGHLYDQQNLGELPDTKMVILCDSQLATAPGKMGWSPIWAMAINRIH
ncbi:hypothetical protein PHYSODRAFT_517670 [Phytophthora sojae]|uniref:Uncharacterized protein n=1 Tax=Phytophthora sojae (strain P6497) TaxID=1094619 RepID=G4ZXB9_PHYSP|nr:hypothetical protein PHYSODRAFT_517670 [Phytophthora sojae]EGZ12535.1 hypothetical protein PHYSODRAFT_517670 [Phytophthora sojae]|eukprot:XP_009532868.1 hypothetical protein PHYSODRAFT_517670 [Phytophthora sojae]